MLTTSIADAFRDFCDREGIDHERLAGLVRDSYGSADGSSLVARVEVGEITGEEFERELARVLSEGLESPVAAEELVERMLDGIELEPRMIDAVRRAREAGTATALLSNSWSSRQYWVEGYEPTELFDAVIISGEVGLRKPDPRIYHLAAERLGLSPDVCVFVDDFRENVDAAAGVGMHALHHEDVELTLARLDTLFR